MSPYSKTDLTISQEFITHVCPFCERETIMFYVMRSKDEETGENTRTLWVVGNENTYCPSCGKREKDIVENVDSANEGGILK